MNTIKCPNCGKEFEITETNYTAILTQIKDHEIEKAVLERETLLVQKYKSNLEAEVSKLEKAHIGSITEKDKLIAELNGKLQNVGVEKDLAVSEAVRKNSEASKLDWEKRERELQDNLLCFLHQFHP